LNTDPSAAHHKASHSWRGERYVWWSESFAGIEGEKARLLSSPYHFRVYIWRCHFT